MLSMPVKAWAWLSPRPCITGAALGLILMNQATHV